MQLHTYTISPGSEWTFEFYWRNANVNVNIHLHIHSIFPETYSWHLLLLPLGWFKLVNAVFCVTVPPTVKMTHGFGIFNVRTNLDAKTNKRMANGK